MRKLIAIIFILLPLLGLQAQKVHDFQLKDLDNQYRSYQELRGEKLTLIDFWATWCKPCLKSIPELEKIYQEYRNSGLEVIGVNGDGPRSVSKVGPVSRSLGISYPVLIDLDSELMNDLKLYAFPSLVLVNATGEVIWVHEGFVAGDELEIRKQIDKALAE